MRLLRAWKMIPRGRRIRELSDLWTFCAWIRFPELILFAFGSFCTFRARCVMDRILFRCYYSPTTLEMNGTYEQYLVEGINDGL